MKKHVTFFKYLINFFYKTFYEMTSFQTNKKKIFKNQAKQKSSNSSPKIPTSIQRLYPIAREVNIERIYKTRKFNNLSHRIYTHFEKVFLVYFQ